jgi:NO-binding membrane sensor protein with MHYT domain
MLQGSYDFRLVGLSVALAMCAAYAALDLSGRVTAAHRWSRTLWLTGGATAMGLGIWAMHYIGMLAFSLPVPVLYHYPTVIVSLLAAIAASAVALFTVSRERMSTAATVAGSLVMGGGIAAMHYIGMAAMRLPAMMEYRWPIVGLSVVLAVVISLVALILAFQARQEKNASPRKLLSHPTDALHRNVGGAILWSRRHLQCPLLRARFCAQHCDHQRRQFHRHDSGHHLRIP